MAIRTIIAAAAPWSSNHNKGKAPAGQMDPRQHSQIQTASASETPSYLYSGYGSTENVPRANGTNSGLSSLRVSPERFRGDSLLRKVPEEGGPFDTQDDVFEEADEDSNWDIEEQGLYSGSYKRLVIVYTLVPFTSLFVFISIALLPLFWPSRSSSVPHPQYMPTPIPEFLIAISLWSLSYLVRVPLFTLASSIFLHLPAASLLVSTFLHTLLQTALRVSSFPLLSLRDQMDENLNGTAQMWEDPVFRRVWWFALCWALADVSVGIAQGYAQIALYRDVLVSPGNAKHHRYGLGDDTRHGKIFLTESPLTMSAPGDDGVGAAREAGSASGRSGSPGGTITTGATRLVKDSIQMEVDRDLEMLVAMKAREELEEVYGVPVIKIPVFISCLQRIDSIILSLGLTLLLSSSYLRSPLSLSTSRPIPPDASNRPFYITSLVVVALHLFLASLYTPLVLPHIGVHTAAYVGLLVGLGCLFSGLGMWGALS